ncbi:hypothetical protein AO284_14160 [Pseudomonas sp. NZIPFR-PS2]|nr:hypothetical protein AO284_14160 [Pseudomonas sp. NZIPFR-PS2]
MCGRLSQYCGIHDFFAALGVPNALANSVGELPLERYNVPPSTQVALLHLQDDVLHTDLVLYRPRRGNGPSRWCYTMANRRGLRMV